MVSTRSHDHTPATIGKGNAKDDGIDVEESGKKKRKSQHDTDAATPSQPASKRRRAVEGLEGDVLPMPQVATAVVVEVKEQHGIGMRGQEPELEPDTRPQEVTETAAPASSRSPRSGFRESHPRTEGPLVEPVSVEMKQGIFRVEAIHGDNHEPGQPPASPNPTKKSKKLKKAKSPIQEVDTTEEPSPEAAQGTKATASPSKQPISIHKRFDSAEPESELPQPQPQEENNVEEGPHDNHSDDSDSSDADEAPETVTASAGQSQALTAALEQSKAAAKLEKAQKLKRQERDVKMKEQAKAAKKETKQKEASKSSKAQGTVIEKAVDEHGAPTSESKAQTANKAKQPLPALLPEYILADESDIRPLIPPPSSTGKAVTFTSQKKRFLDLEQKTPKDINKGGVKIRVLQDGSGVLPPKASQQGKALREAWLMGRRGRGTVVERRKMKCQGGFIRR